MVLIHGFPFDAELWDPQFEALGREYRLIAPDLRGFGNSSATTEYSIGAFAEDIAGLLDRLEVERAVVGGLSMGGYTALELLRHHRARVMALVLADTRAEADAPEIRARREAQQDQVIASGSDSLVDAFLQTILSEETRSDRPRVVDALKGLMEQPDASWIGGLEAMKNRRDSSDLLGAIDIPTLIVVGEHDAVTPVEVARAMHDGVRGSRLVVIEGAGHISNLESPAAFNAALKSFVDEL